MGYSTAIPLLIASFVMCAPMTSDHDDPTLQKLRQMLMDADPAPPTDAPERPGRLAPWASAALIGGNAGDAASTVLALQNPNAHEANPIFGAHPSTGKVLAIKGGVTLAEWLLMRRLAKQHPKLANGLSAAIGGTMGAIAASNLSKR